MWFLAVFVAGGLCSCAYPGGYNPAWLNQFMAPQPTSYSAYRRSRYHEHWRVAHVRSHHRDSDVAKKAAPTATIEDAAAVPSPAPVARPQVTLTLAGDNQDRERARNLLRKTDATLVQVSRRPLSNVQKETYERASELAGRARRAFANDDYAAASSLAVKASALSAEMNGQ
jgi:hypothetical protein